MILNGSGSSDPEGDALSYTWTGQFGTATGVSPTVSLPIGIHMVSLEVTDAYAQKSHAVVLVAVVQGVGSSEYASMQSQLSAANAQVATLSAANQVLTQKNAALLSLLQLLKQKFEQIQALAQSINGVGDDGKQVINQALAQ